MGREDKFYEMCTKLPIEEQLDERGEDSIPELVRVAELRDAGSTQEAIDYAKALAKMYPDNDLVPFMTAYIYYQKEFPVEARSVAIEAIPKCLRKYRLYSVVGLAEFDLDHLPEALAWWSRSVIAQCTVVDYQEYDPFMYIGQVAEILGAKRQAQLFYSMTDAIEPSMPRADDHSTQKLAGIKKSWAREPFERVLKFIDSNYLQG